MKLIKTKIQGPLKIKSNIYQDKRGYLRETFRNNLIKNKKFPFDVMSFSKKNVLRGLHLQIKKPQGKFVTVLRGKIFDVALDCRKNSKTFGKYKLIKLNDKNRLQIYIPKNFGHAYLTLKNNTIVNYKVSNYYSPNQSICISYLDPMINLQLSIKKIILSKNDKNGLFIKDIMDKL